MCVLTCVCVWACVCVCELFSKTKNRLQMQSENYFPRPKGDLFIANAIEKFFSKTNQLFHRKCNREAMFQDEQILHCKCNRTFVLQDQKVIRERRCQLFLAGARACAPYLFCVGGRPAPQTVLASRWRVAKQPQPLPPFAATCRSHTRSGSESNEVERRDWSRWRPSTSIACGACLLACVRVCAFPRRAATWGDRRRVAWCATAHNCDGVVRPETQRMPGVEPNACGTRARVPPQPSPQPST